MRTPRRPLDMASDPARAVVLAALFLLLVPLTPSASACSWAIPQGFDVLEWPIEETLVTSHGWTAGTFSLEDGTFQPVASTALELEAALSPDGIWFVTVEGTFRTARPEGMRDTCDAGYARVRATNLTSGDAVLVSDHGASALAASPEHLALAQGSSVSLLVWGAFTEEARLQVEAPSGNTFRGPFYALEFSGGGDRLLGWGNGLVMVWDLPGAEAVRRETLGSLGALNVWAAALSPDGERFAVAGNRLDSGGDGNGEVFVSVRSVASGEVLAEWTNGTAAPGSVEPRALAWGPEGLAASIIPRHHAEEGGPHDHPQILLFDEQLAPKATVRSSGYDAPSLAWSSDGARLAAGAHGELRVYDPQFRELGRWTLPPVDPGEGPPGEVPSDRAPFVEEEQDREVPGQGSMPMPGALAVFVVLALAALTARGGRRVRGRRGR